MTGEELGGHGPPISVDVVMTVPHTPSFWEKIGLKKVQPQTQTISFYVCCEECAAKVKSAPNASAYAAKAVVERRGLLN